MRILLVGDAESPHLRRWAQALGESCKVVVAGFGSLEATGVEFVPLGPARPSPRRYLAAVPHLARLARKLRPDVAHGHYVSSYGVLASQSRFPCPLVLSTWGTDILWMDRRPHWQQWLTRKALSSASLVTYESSEIHQHLKSLVDESRLVRILFGPEQSWSQLPRDEQRRLFSPRLPRPLYRVSTIVEAFDMISSSHAGWELDIATWDLSTAQLKDVGLGQRDDERVQLLPLLDRSTFQRQMLRSAAFCSVPETDSTSVTLLEGMASGSLPIVSDIPANREWVDDGVNGLVVPVGDIPTLAAALERAVLDTQFRIEAAELNRDLIAREASWENAIDNLLGNYALLTRDSPRPHRQRGAHHGL